MRNFSKIFFFENFIGFSNKFVKMELLDQNPLIPGLVKNQD
jgi:hypothetical protein